jgi:hypothetical protein
MEGFNLFQEKIKGEVTMSAIPDTSVFFLPQDVCLNADLLALAETRCSSFNYQSFNENLLMDCLEAEAESEGPAIDLRIDFCDASLQQMPTLDDLRYTFFNYNNDLGSCDKKRVIMLFE